MPASISTDQVWREIEKRMFAVLGFVSGGGEARTAGIVYAVHERELYIATARTSWKARHIERAPHVSLTVLIPKRIPLMPWIKIPPATITFQGVAEVLGPDATPAEALRAVTKGLEFSPEEKARICILKVLPRGDFVTYGVGVPLMTMKKPDAARGRVAVASSREAFP